MLDSLKQKKNFKRIKMRIKTGDLVKVINGKEKGKTGEVLKTIPLENRVVVKGVNPVSYTHLTLPTTPYV